MRGIRMLMLGMVVAFVVSCGTKKSASTGEATSNISVEEMKALQEKLNLDYEVIYLRGNVKYKDSEKSLPTSSIDIRIKKDAIILVSVRFLGVTIGKAKLTPQEFSYYEKSGRYFTGDYAFLSKWLGVELNYNQVQQMLTGRPMEALTTKFDSSIDKGFYEFLLNNKNSTIVYAFDVNGDLREQGIALQDKEKELKIFYPDFQTTSIGRLPKQLRMRGEEANKTIEITVDYNQTTLNEDLGFPYRIPQGYEMITLD